MDQRLLNGRPKVTVIQRFDHSIILIGPPPSSKMEFLGAKSLESVKHYIEEQGYEINIAHIHPGQVEKD